MGSCCMNVGSVLVGVGFALGLVSYFAPFWREWIILGVANTQGLWANCGGLQGEGKCTWFWENKIGHKESQLPDWHKAAQALFTVGLALVLAVQILLFLYGCCRSCRENALCLTRIVISFLFIGSICLGVSLAVYAAKALDSKSAGLLSQVKLFWAFYIGAASAVCIFAGAIIFLVESCRMRSV